VDQNCTSSKRAEYVGLKSKPGDANFLLNMKLMLDDLAK
jgi:hypothetical protein